NDEDGKENGRSPSWRPADGVEYSATSSLAECSVSFEGAACMTFTCPECGFNTDDPVGAVPYVCERCRDEDNRVVYLQNRTPGNTIGVRCGCGFSFAVPFSFSDTLRPCPKCGRKCPVPVTTPTRPPGVRKAVEVVDQPPPPERPER